MFAGLMHPFREYDELKKPEPDVLLEQLSTDAGNDQVDEWLGWDAWVYAEDLGDFLHGPAAEDNERRKHRQMHSTIWSNVWPRRF